MTRDVARGSLLGMVGQAWQMVTAFLLYALLARWFGPAVFGRWRLVLSLLAWFEVFIAAAVVKVITREIGARPAEAGRIARAAYAAQGLVAVTVFAAVELAAGRLASLLGDASLVPLIRVAALDIPLFALLSTASALVLGRQRFVRQGVGWIVYATAKAALIAGLVAAGYGAAGALAGNALSSLVGFAALWWWPRREETSRRTWRDLVGPMLLAALPFLALSLMDTLGANADLWIFSRLGRDAGAVGLYAAAAIFAEVPVFLFLGLDRVIFASVVSARSEGDAAGADAYATAALRTAVAVSMFGVAMAASAGRQAIELVYSSAFAGAFAPLVVLMVAALGRSVQATAGNVLMAQGRRRTALGLLGAAVTIEVIGVAVLTPGHGMVGAAAGAAAGACAGALGAAFALRASTGLRPALTLLRCAAAAVVVGGLIAWWAPAPLLLVLALPAGAVVYVAALRLLRELSPADMAAMRAAVGR